MNSTETIKPQLADGKMQTKQMTIFCWLICNLLLSSTLLTAQTEGEQLFNRVCVACHTINKGRLVGPDLANITDRRPEEWIISFVQSSQTVIKSGDAYATNLFQQFNGLVMPDNPFTADQIRSIIQYISANSPAGGAAESTPAQVIGRPLSEATAEDVAAGENLFVGRTRFAKGGPSCNSCHHVNDTQVPTGGALAKDLTHAFSRLGDGAIRSLMNRPAFPAMQAAFAGKPLTDEEVFQLTAYLQSADRVEDLAAVRDYGLRLFFSGLAAALVMMGLVALLWLRGKRDSVNRALFERQIKSV